MAPKISSVLGFHEREQLHKNPSILAYTGDVGQNYLDLGDGYGDQEGEQNTTAPPRHRCTNAENKKATRSSRLTSFSSSLNSARTAMVSHAKKLHVRESTRQALNQLRMTMVESSSSRMQRSQSQSIDSMRPDHESNQLDNDHVHFGVVGHEAGVENAGYECMYAEVSLGNGMFSHSPSWESTATKSRLSRILPPRPWIKSSTQKRKVNDELY